MTIVITGANRGIGRGLFDAYPAGTVIGTHRAPSTDDMLQLDVTDPASQADFGAAMKDRPVDLLICNAGVYLDKGEDLNTGYGADLWAQSFAANVTGVFLTVQTLLPNLRAAKGKLAIISSQMASHTRAPGGSYIYRSSKAAALNLGRNLATDLARDEVAVGIYHPGWVQTDMGGSAAAITVDAAVAGLVAQFDDLSMADTGCFLTYDGQPHAY